MTITSSNLTHLYQAWQATASAADLAFVDAVFTLCERNYEAGGDVIVECYGPTDILEAFKTLDDVKDFCGLHLEAAANARWGEDDDAEINRPAWEDDPRAYAEQAAEADAAAYGFENYAYASAIAAQTLYNRGH